MRSSGLARWSRIRLGSGVSRWERMGAGGILRVPGRGLSSRVHPSKPRALIVEEGSSESTRLARVGSRREVRWRGVGRHFWAAGERQTGGCTPYAEDPTVGSRPPPRGENPRTGIVDRTARGLPTVRKTPSLGSRDARTVAAKAGHFQALALGQKIRDSSPLIGRSTARKGEGNNKRERPAKAGRPRSWFIAAAAARPLPRSPHPNDQLSAHRLAVGRAGDVRRVGKHRVAEADPAAAIRPARLSASPRGLPAARSRFPHQVTRPTRRGCSAR